MLLFQRLALFMWKKLHPEVLLFGYFFWKSSKCSLGQLASV